MKPVDVFPTTESHEPERWHTMSQVAKLIGIMGRNKMYEFLRNKGVLMHHNEPYQRLIDQGYFRMELVNKYSSKGLFISSFPVLLVSSKGIIFIKELLNEKLIEKSNE